MTLEFQLGLLAVAYNRRLKNNVFACIDDTLRVHNQTGSNAALVAVFINVIRELASPAAIREMQRLAGAAAGSSSGGSSCTTKDPAETSHGSSVFSTDSVSSLETQVQAGRCAAGSNSGDKSSDTLEPEETSDGSSIFSIETDVEGEVQVLAGSRVAWSTPRDSFNLPTGFSFDTEGQEEMMGMPVTGHSSEWTHSDSDTLDKGEPTEAFDDSA
jgi:hypothetical protein